MSVRVGDVVLVEVEIFDRYSGGSYEIPQQVRDEQIVGVVRQAFRKGDKVRSEGGLVGEIRAIDEGVALVRSEIGAFTTMNLHGATRVDE